MGFYNTTAFKRLSDGFKASWFCRPDMLQVAALCYRHVGDGHEILLVTSRGRGRWILPKGWPKKKISSAQTALEEAFEEAGIRGEVCENPIGTYHYEKLTKYGFTMNCMATVYEVIFTQMAADFPEKGDRDVKWFTPEAAAEAVSAPELAKLLRDFQPSVSASAP